MRISDWSSDVCSSDLHWGATGFASKAGRAPVRSYDVHPANAAFFLRRADARCVSLPPMSAESLPLFPLHTVLLPGAALGLRVFEPRSEEHTSELLSLMRISYAVFCLKKKNTIITSSYAI